MFTRLYEKFKNFMKENYRSIFAFAFCYIVLMWPVDYYITTGGGTIDIKNRVQIENSYSSKGSMHLAYVSELQGNIATFLLSYVMKDWERIDTGDYKIDEKEDIEAVSFRNQLELKSSIDAATQVAYQKAGKKVTIKKEQLYIVYVSKNSKSKLKVGDELLLVAGEKIKDFDALRNIISGYEVGDKIPITIMRNGKSKKIEAEVYEEDKQKLIGISISKIASYETDPKLKLYFKESESGPSGGMMLCLDIYNKLTKEDITKGHKIVGTGTISRDGTVGEISGVKYKLMGAVKEKADIFLVPKGDNYKEAVKVAKSKNYDIQIIGVKNIDEALMKLEKLSK